MSFRVLFGGNCSNFFWYFFSGVCSVFFFPVFCPLPFVMVVGFWDRLSGILLSVKKPVGNLPRFFTNQILFKRRTHLCQVFMGW